MRDLRCLLIGTGLALSALAGCDGGSGDRGLGSGDVPPEDTVGPLCAECGPSNGGETGDFGGELIDCSPFWVGAPIEEAEAAQLDVSQLESTLARPIDESMRWSLYDDPNPKHQAFAVSGYEASTRIEAAFTLDGPFRFLRSEGCVAPHCYQSCASRIEVDVSIALQSADAAVQATVHGTVVHTFTNAFMLGSPLLTFFNAYADLRDVIGTVRFMPALDARFHGRLAFSGTRGSQFATGGLSFFVDIDGERIRDDLPSIEGQNFLPLRGSFPN